MNTAIITNKFIISFQIISFYLEIHFSDEGSKVLYISAAGKRCLSQNENMSSLLGLSYFLRLKVESLLQLF